MSELTAIRVWFSAASVVAADAILPCTPLRGAEADAIADFQFLPIFFGSICWREKKRWKLISLHTLINKTTNLFKT